MGICYNITRVDSVCIKESYEINLHRDELLDDRDFGE